MEVAGAMKVPAHKKIVAAAANVPIQQGAHGKSMHLRSTQDLLHGD